ncbi:UDP-glucosyltransferase 2-like [Aphomia sociella]
MTNDRKKVKALLCLSIDIESLMEKSMMWLLLLILINASFTESYKILVSFPVPSKSHKNLGQGIIRNLLKAGHDITYITPYPMDNPPANLRQIDVSSESTSILTDILNIKQIMDKEVDIKDFKLFFKIINAMNNGTFENENMQRLLNDPNEQFDLYIIEWFYSEIHVGVSTVFECPYIWVSSMEPHWLVTRLVDEYLHPAYNPDIQSTSTVPFSFYERTIQLISQFLMTAISMFYMRGTEENAYADIFGPILAKRGRALPPYTDVLYNGSLILGNSHVSLGQATRLPQNYKSIGGYHIDEDVKPLPEDLKQILDNAEHGVIYFSMGSILKSKDLPDDLKKSLFKMFGEIKYTVLWKFEEELPNRPKNVHILKWAPQQSILAHPNCVLFITHGGLLSTTETVHFGKPMIGIPVFADQFINVQRMVAKGFAKKVDISYSLADELKIAIIDILQDPSYTIKAKELSYIYRHRPVSPGKELVHWVEHVIRTGGAKHLRSPALSVPLYQKLYLDLLALIVVSLIIIKVVITKVLSLILKKKRIDVKKLQ